MWVSDNLSHDKKVYIKSHLRTDSWSVVLVLVVEEEEDHHFEDVVLETGEYDTFIIGLKLMVHSRVYTDKNDTLQI